ncbi:ectonucleotide pyrophosphatase/phosphodiesterase family member 5-like [Periplaneta americana]|uniref:ectonucleotide pyrophosphatase/phosphodiesterase family member 5-like n=1 Tax=Periplaneta americana TaxID=6978 RepID=UPI0037E9A78B
MSVLPVPVTFCLIFILTFELVSPLSRHPLLLIVSFDGFRHDFFTKRATPGLNRFKTDGTHAPFTYNVFPTKTFPNHHSIATGLFPESHGVLGNEVYDPILRRILHFGPEMYNTEGVTPIWTLNQMAASDRYSGVMMWPGGTFSYSGITPKFHHAWNMSVPWEWRVDTATDWFKHASTPANLVVLYFEEPDTTAHTFGPESPQVLSYIQKVDNITTYLRQSLVSKGLLYKVNVVLLSDHGMATVTPQRIFNLTHYINKAFFQIVDTSPVLQIRPTKGKESVVYNALKTASQTANFSVYQSSELPARWHYAQSARTPPILAVADIGYAFQDLIEWYQDWYQRKFHITLSPTSTLGLHGYDNNEPCMRPFFIASGPLVKTGHSVQPFQTVDLYSLFSVILGVTPASNNGTFSNVRGILKNPPAAG